MAANAQTQIRVHVQQRHIIVNRTPANSGMMAVNRQRRAVHGMLTHSLWSGSNPDLTSIGCDDIQVSRDAEKKDLQDLNERLAEYIESNRFFRIQNHKLALELERLRKIKLGNESANIKLAFEVELKDMRNLLDDAIKEKGRLVIELHTSEELRIELRHRLDLAEKDAEDAKANCKGHIQELAKYKGEVSLLQQQIASLESEKNKEKELIQTLKDTINRLRQDLNTETLLHIDAESRRQSLEEELQFIKTIHSQELKEREALIGVDSTADNHAFWKLEIGQALRDIHQTYDERLESIWRDAETTYNARIEQFRIKVYQNNTQYAHFKEENERLREQNQILIDRCDAAESKYNRLRLELERLKQEYETSERECEKRKSELHKQIAMLLAEREATLKEIKLIRDTKHGLELEIITYRRLLELEENSTGLNQAIFAIESTEERGGGGGAAVSGSVIRETTTNTSQSVSHTIRGEMTARIAFQKKAKGPVEFDDFSPDGKYVALINNGRKDEVLGNWSLVRKIDGAENITYKFHESVVLRPQQKMKVWSKGSKPTSGAEYDIESNQIWGVGRRIYTQLISPAGEERAYCNQDTVFGENAEYGQ